MAIEKLPTGRWRASVQHNGVRRRSAPLPTKAAAKQAEAELRLSLTQELGPSARQPEQVASMTIGDLVRLNLEHSRFSATYEAETRRTLDRLPTLITHRQASTVTPLQAARWWQQLAREGWSEHRVRRVHEVLSSAYGRAIRLGVVRVNPLRDVAPPKPSASEIVLPSADTVPKVLAVVDDPCFAALVVVIATTGVRRGEAVGIKWGDITTGDKGARLTIRRAVSYTPASGVVIKDTKTAAKGRRTIPLPPETVQALARWKAAQADRLTIEAVMPEAFVFSLTGDAPHRPDWAQYKWAKACKAAGVTAHLHELRHAFVSSLLEAGENPVRVSRLAGHARTSTTLDIYGHLLEG